MDGRGCFDISEIREINMRYASKPEPDIRELYLAISEEPGGFGMNRKVDIGEDVKEIEFGSRRLG